MVSQVSKLAGIVTLKLSENVHLKLRILGILEKFLFSNSNCVLNTRRSVLILVPLEPQGLEMVKNVSFRFSTYFGKSG